MDLDLTEEYRRLAEQRTTELLVRNRKIAALEQEREELKCELEALKAQMTTPKDAGEVDVSKMSAKEKMEYGRSQGR